VRIDLIDRRPFDDRRRNKQIYKHTNKIQATLRKDFLTACARLLQKTTNGRAGLKSAALTVGHLVAAKITSMTTTTALRYAHQFPTIVGGGRTSRRLAKSNQRVQDHPKSNQRVQERLKSN
jgi:hypothetical protein